MSRSIEVDEDVLALLRTNAQPLGESENDVLRRLLLPVGSDAPAEHGVGDERVPRQRRRAVRDPGETVHELMTAGFIEPGDVLINDQHGRRLRAVVLEDGRLRLSDDGTEHASPSSALHAVVGHDTDAWTTWHHVATSRTLAELRELQIV